MRKIKIQTVVPSSEPQTEHQIVRAGERTEDAVTVRRYGLCRLPCQTRVLKALSFLPYRPWQCWTVSCNPMPWGMWLDSFRTVPNFDVVHATVLIHAAGTGVTLTLAATPPEERDPRLSETMREAILTAITVPASAVAPDGGSDAAPPAERVAVHAVALRALLAEAPSVLSPAERQLLSDWLERLATAGNLRAPMRRPPPAPRRRPSSPAIKPRPS